jgi:uncharacterized protein (DUF305 family)
VARLRVRVTAATSHPMSCTYRFFFALILAASVSAACRTAGGDPAAVAATAPPPSTAAQTAGPPSPAPPLIVQPGAPGQASKVVGAAAASDLSKVGFTPADTKFMQGMIGHHSQAIEMVELLNTHSANADMKKLGLRIQVSQEDEIKMMQDWLRARGQEIPGPHAHHTGMLMPGMLTPEEMSRLGNAKGVQFDRLFLEGMIKHHGGALVMVDELFAQPGAAQDSDIYAFASDVVADQRMEMDRMAAMLKELQK